MIELAKMLLPFDQPSAASPVLSRDVSSWEETEGVSLPECYKAVLGQVNGGDLPFPVEVCGADISCFFGIAPVDVQNSLTRLSRVLDELYTKELTALLGVDDLDDLVCFSFDGTTAFAFEAKSEGVCIADFADGEVGLVSWKKIDLASFMNKVVDALEEAEGDDVFASMYADKKTYRIQLGLATDAKAKLAISRYFNVNKLNVGKSMPTYDVGGLEARTLIAYFSGFGVAVSLLGDEPPYVYQKDWPAVDSVVPKMAQIRREFGIAANDGYGVLELVAPGF